jgi:hypothetical protein
MNRSDLTRLNGQSVLVKSTAEQGDPKIALRGTIEATPDESGGKVRIVLEFPDMSNRASHQGIIALDEANAARLLASEHDGTYEYTTARPLDPPGPEPIWPQAVS